MAMKESECISFSQEEIINLLHKEYPNLINKENSHTMDVKRSANNKDNYLIIVQRKAYQL